MIDSREVELRTRALVRLGALCALLTAAGCVRRPFFAARNELKQVKTVAVIQFVDDLYNANVMGAAFTDEGRKKTTEQSYELFTSGMGQRWRVLPRAAVMDNPKYRALSTEELRGPCWTPTGFRALKGGTPGDARLDPVEAARAAEALNVDAVIAVAQHYGVWARKQFGGRSYNRYRVNMYDRTGKRIWGDEVEAESTLDWGYSVLISFGIWFITSDPDDWVEQNLSAFGVALETMKRNLDAPPDPKAK